MGFQIGNYTQVQCPIFPHNKSLSNEPQASNEISSDRFKSFWRVFQADGAAYLKTFDPSSVRAIGTNKNIL